MNTDTSSVAQDATDPNTRESVSDLRLWPAFVISLLQCATLGLTVTPAINNAMRFGIMMLGPAICILLFGVWILFFSRMRWRDRFSILLGLIVLGIVASQLVEPTMGVTLWIYGVPVAILLTTAWLWFGANWPASRRTGSVLIALACGWSLFLAGRMEGFDGSYWPELRWRWSETSEVAMSSASASISMASETEVIELVADANDWSGFRGVARNGHVRQGSISSDWNAAPLRELWRIPIGPAWSSFAAVDDRLFTQEQRGDNELVVCYDAASGTEIWRHADPSRFSEVVSGPGPRATPTFANGRIYTLGGHAIFNCLDASTGKLKWQHDLMSDFSMKMPIWGFSASPIVVDDLVVVFAGALSNGALVAYDASTGEQAWNVDTSGMNYSSPQLITIADRKLVLLAGTSQVIAVSPATGESAWKFEHNGQRSMSIVQPQQIDATRIVVPFGDGGGLACVEVEFVQDAWKVSELWTTQQLKPSFNDFVYHKGHLYGFDQHIFTCIDAETGTRQWKRGRYGFGQVILFPEQDLLLVASEKGELVLVKATPEQHVELARTDAITGKTWNHPIVSRNRLVVRNASEAACYDLSADAE